METVWVHIEDWDKLLHWFGSVENIEILFRVEFSCGNGLFLSQLEADQDWNTFNVYDGHVDPSLFTYEGRLMQGPCRFKFSYNEDAPFNGKPMFSDCKVVKG